MNKSKAQSGFSLIELLVVITMIGLLAGLILSNFNSARARARDAARKSDLNQVKAALRIYYNDFQTFPATGTGDTIAGCGAAGDQICSWGSDAFATTDNTYMKQLPDDPLAPAQDYIYAQTNNGDGFTLTATLENQSDPEAAQSQSRCSVGSDSEYVICED